MSKPNYLHESVLLSELILFNNLKKLKEHPRLYNDKYLKELEELRDYSVELEQSPEKGLQKKKKEVRNKIRDLSSKTYVYRDTDLFGEMISTMADRILTRPQFSGYTIKEEMKGLGIEYVLKYAHNFDPFKTSNVSGQPVSSFAYISTIIFNGIIQVINSFNRDQEKMKNQIQEHQQLYLKDNKDKNVSEAIPEFEDIEHKEIILDDLNSEKLITEMKKVTINEPTMFIIPRDYYITPKDYEYILKYSIAIKRI